MKNSFKVSLLVFLVATSLLMSQTPVAKSSTAIYLRADGSVYPQDAPIFSEDNVTYILTANITESIIVERDNIVIDGFGHTVRGFAGGVGLNLTERHNVIVQNITVKLFQHGLYLLRSANITVSDSVISNNTYGIWFSLSSSNLVSNNLVTNNSYGFVLILFSNLNTIVRNIISGNIYGIRLDYISEQNTINGNTIKGNHGGALFILSSNNYIYHNNFINNVAQVQVSGEFQNIWDDGYPSGGNHWGDHIPIDVLSGPFQNETGSDGIADVPFMIDVNNVDRYPIVAPWSPTAITAKVWIKPDVLNLGVKQGWVAVYVGFISDHSVGRINVSETMVNGTLSAEPSLAVISDYDGDGKSDLAIRFNRTLVKEYIRSKGLTTGDIVFKVSGYLFDRTPFVGYCAIKIRMCGDVNTDGVVDLKDVLVVKVAFGSYPAHPHWNDVADENEDGQIDLKDIYIVASNYGQTYA
ncbi:right-handed parallel beta-helix repeat-containing protein [Candidatus Bathyarchaeota archaeon]|nr:right-handed parallel beta-helix repeat-containing protein [Candidatus Bathyarchaeota archaeon]